MSEVSPSNAPSTTQAKVRGSGSIFAGPIFQLVNLAGPAVSGWRWALAAVLVGTVPFLISTSLQIPGHQWVSGALLAWLCLPLIRRDRFWAGTATMALAFVSHSVLVISFSHLLPDWAEPVLPGAADYWNKQQTWILTGQDPEYEMAHWIPAHLALLAAATLWDFSSLGVLTFHHGFFEVDLMNYYNGQLLGRSTNRPWGIALGWHIWSLLRGAGYLLLTYETCSLALQTWTCQRLSSPQRRAARWGAGLGLLICDAIAKAWLLGPVRNQLFENWQ